MIYLHPFFLQEWSTVSQLIKPIHVFSQESPMVLNGADSQEIVHRISFTIQSYPVSLQYN